MNKIKIAYIGGGSKMWAPIFMNDLALCEGIGGEIALYDIDLESSRRNQKIGEVINNNPQTKIKWEYQVYEGIDEALKNATFVIISILPGTFEEMRSDVHDPEAYGIYQSVGDTVGPGGILRSMRTVPLYEGFAKKIKENCPNAWVLNLTNPMSICTKTLYDVFPEIKAFGCCHEVFHAQQFLCVVLKEVLGIEGVTRHDIYTDASGINHFTWISEAKYKDIDLLSILPQFIKKYYEEGYYEEGNDRFAFKKDCFAYGNKVKMDLFKRYGVLGAAGDRHLVEFMNNTWYLKDKEMVEDFKYNLTTVDFRVAQQQERLQEAEAVANRTKEIKVTKSPEEVVELMKALLGQETIVSNVNMPNRGQVEGLPLGSIVETNCVFSNDQVCPVVSKKLPNGVLNLVARNNYNIETTYEGIKNRDLNKIFEAFVNQPLCSTITIMQAKELFKTMLSHTRKYLDDFYDIDSFIKTE